jgi:hypothetical protein
MRERAVIFCNSEGAFILDKLTNSEYEELFFITNKHYIQATHSLLIDFKWF